MDIFPKPYPQLKPEEIERRRAVGRSRYRNNRIGHFEKSKVLCDPSDLTAAICRASFFEFLKEFWSVVCAEQLKLNWHIPFMCSEAQEIAERVFAGTPREYDLIVNVPPATTKSKIWSVAYPPWVWTRMPSARFICGSHTENLVYDLSRQARDIVKSDKYKQLFPYVEIRDDQDTKGYWMNTAGGDRFSCTVGGKTPTGMHAHFLIIDDPLDPKKALSEIELKNATNWMESTLPSRKVDKLLTPTILVMQRLHQADPTGNLLDKKGARIRHICLPAEIYPNIKPAYLRRKYVGGKLDPTRLSEQALSDQRIEGEYHYASQYLQDPTPLGGGMFKIERIRIDEPPPDREFKFKCRYWDKAATHGGGAFTVGVLMGVDVNNRFWILDVVRGQWDTATREKQIDITARMDGPDVIIGIEQEPASGGKESAEQTAKRLAGHRIRIVRPTGEKGGKVIRADAYSTQVNMSNVRMKEAMWNKDYIVELRYFPYGRYKDQVDASTGAFTVLTNPVTIVGSMF